MNNEQKEMLIDLEKKIISDLTDKLKEETKKVKLFLSDNELKIIFENCINMLIDLNKSIKTLKTITN